MIPPLDAIIQGMFSLLDRPRQAAWEAAGIPDELSGSRPLDALAHALGDPVSLGVLALLAAKRRFAPARGLLRRPQAAQTPLGEFPQYPGGPEKLEPLRRRLREAIAATGQEDEIIKLIPPDAEIMGRGHFAQAMRTPEGDILKLSWQDWKDLNPPNIPGVAQPSHIANVGPLTIIRMPEVELLGLNPIERLRTQAAVHKQIEQAGYDTMDLNPLGNNFGYLDGQPVILDYGSVTGPYGTRPMRWGALGTALGLYHGLARGGAEN